MSKIVDDLFDTKKVTTEQQERVDHISSPSKNHAEFIDDNCEDVQAKSFAFTSLLAARDSAIKCAKTDK